ncbi:uncharacterized protein LOC133306625 [Gastrolobium bilobum]|uniref:uncharacterized protein LOC133306625 n=1 Tax=Gastrolobium bilobum TaxID=150636 RepID=UPI002AB3136C|nr:uncharacterized protein LOC133306625 [Gastrolobium bilobum]
MVSSNQRQPPPFAAKSSDKYANPTSTQPLPPPLTTTYPTHPPPGSVYTQGYPLYTNGYPYPPTAPPNYGTQIRRIRPFSLYCGILAAVCFFLAIFIIAVALRPKLPVYKVVSMSVANFTVTPALSGEWDTNISIENRNHMVRVFISD